MLIFLLLIFTSNINLELIEYVKKDINKPKSFSVDLIFKVEDREADKFRINFLENKNDSSLPFLAFIDLKENIHTIYFPDRKYEYKNDTLFLDTNKYNLFNDAYSASHLLLYPINTNQVRTRAYTAIHLLLDKYYKDINDSTLKIYKYLNDTVYYQNDTLNINFKFHVIKDNPYSINIKGEFTFLYDKNKNLLKYLDRQSIVDENDSSFRSLEFTNYNFNTPDLSLFDTTRAYKVLINVDSVRIANKRESEKIKLTSNKLPSNVQLLDKSEIDLTKHKDIKVYNFWGSWCGFCYLSYPSIYKIYEKYNDKIEVVGWSAYENNVSKIAPYIKKKKINFPYILGADSLAKKLSVTGFPSTLIFKGDSLYYKCKNNNDSLYYEIEEILIELGIK